MKKDLKKSIDSLEELNKNMIFKQPEGKADQ